MSPAGRAPQASASAVKNRDRSPDAEAAGVPSVALMHAVAERPLPGVPPYGPGWQPGLGLSGKLRDAIGHFALNRLYRRDGLSLLNDARVALGLIPLMAASALA